MEKVNAIVMKVNAIAILRYLSDFSLKKPIIR